MLILPGPDPGIFPGFATGGLPVEQQHYIKDIELTGNQKFRCIQRVGKRQFSTNIYNP